MNALRKSAKLEQKSAPLKIGEIAYLDNLNNSNNEKETLILIHGLGADKDTWLQFAKYLTKHYRIIAPDLPGHGHSIQDISINYSVTSQAQHIVDLLQHLNISSAHIVGSSMGGAIATRLTHMHPELVSSLVLIDSYGVQETPGYVYKLANEIGYNPMLEINTKDDYKRMMSLAMVKPPFLPGFMLDVLTKDMKERINLNNKIFEDSEEDSDLISILPQINTQTLLIWGKQDKVLHVDNAETFLKKLQNCSQIIIEKAGHVPMVEQPKNTAKYINNFLKKLA